MRVSIACQGRFHMFDLARQMARFGHLQRLYTGYPRFKVHGLENNTVRTFPWLMAPYMIANRLGLGSVVRWMPSLVNSSFDRWVAARLEPCDVYHCLSASGLYSHRVARGKYGALSVCDRGSTHISHQIDIVGEEFDLQGLPPPKVSQHLIDRELAEYEECDLICVPSRVAYDSFVQQGVPEQKLRINPYGVETDLFRPLPKMDDAFRVIYVGALSLRKGVQYLLEAVAELKLAKFETWLIGSSLPETRTILSRYRDRFKYVGVIDRRRLSYYYSQGSVFVLASVEEGLALVQAQAMACGLPVIATTNTGAPDLFTDGVEGFIVPIRDPEAIREKILLLYQNPALREEMSRAALRRVSAMGGWNEYGDRALRIYREALAGKDGAADARAAL